jgi:hypothetical protein
LTVWSLIGRFFSVFWAHQTSSRGCSEEMEVVTCTKKKQEFH